MTRDQPDLTSRPARDLTSSFSSTTHLPSDFNLSDSDVAALLAQELGKYFKPEEIIEARGKYLDKGWPEEYVNRDTGKPYKPHNLLEARAVLSDSPKHLAVLGGEGCLAAETLIAGIPIADLTSPFTTQTLLGQTVALPAILKGRASLYRVVTQSGAVVVATSEHQFLTPVEWRPLASLVVGDAIAAYDTEHGLPYQETPIGCQGCCSVDSHLGDGLPTPAEVVVRSKWQQLRNSVCESNARYLLSHCVCHPCTRCSSCRVEPTQPQSVSSLHTLLAACGCAQMECQCSWQSLHTSRRSDTSGQVRPSVGHTCWDRTPELLCPVLFSESAAGMCVGCQACQQYDLGRVSLPITSLSALDHTSHGKSDQCRFCSVCSLPTSSICQISCQSLVCSLSLDMSQSQPYRQSYSPPTNDYNSFWSIIQSINYVKDGDFYDFHVPVANHYAAAGLWHHNSGKSVMGIIKDLERLRKGMSGVMISPDLEHTKKSIWPEFRRWCPWDKVVEKQQYRQDAAWEPQHAFTLVFNSDVGIQSTLMIGGAVETDLKSWEGPNINFVHLDELRRHRTPIALKTLLGRVRIPGPNGEPPQLYMTTTPSKHWLFDYFGPLACTCTDCRTDYNWQLILNTVPTCPNCGSTHYVTEDPWHDFKLQSAVVRLRTEDNEENLEAGFAKSRALSLTAAEARVLLDAEWEDLSEVETFLPSMTLWDLCQSKDIPPLTDRDPVILAIDAAKGRTSSYSDCFAIVGVSRHWDKDKRRDTCVVRFVLTWQARPGGKIDFVGTESNPGPELVIRNLCSRFNIIQVAYDPYELHDFGMRLSRDRVAWFKEFAQMTDRTESDSDLLQLILSRRIVHDGNQTLRSHIANADRKVSDDGRKLRIVKRLDHLKIDAAVALSMACYRCLHLNIA